jgi:hypothetical protein
VIVICRNVLRNIGVIAKAVMLASSDHIEPNTLLVKATYQGILFKTTIFFDPVQDDTDRIVKVKHCSKHVVHMIGWREQKQKVDIF